MTIPLPPQCWRVVRCHDFVLKAWPDGVVVYDESNGGVHALHPLAGEVLGLLQAHEALDARGLLHLLSVDEPTEEELSQLTGLLMELETLGFIEHASP